MTTIVEPVPAHARRSYQRHVESLLEEIERRRQRLYVLLTRGARPAGLRDLKAELQAVRNELAAVVAAAGSPAVEIGYEACANGRST